MKLGLVFTNDWELLGDGTGDYFEVQHRPLEQLAAVMQDYGARLTVMAEVAQQWAHLELADRFSWAKEIATAWESILTRIVAAGHDAQLHLHPQWLDATHEGDGWKLHFDRWAVSSLSRSELYRVISHGKAYLESLLTPADPSYECLAFRAGAYTIQPSRDIVPSLVASGFLCDTSVTKGIVQDELYDFRNAHSNCIPWHADPEHIECQADIPSGLMEMPIYSATMWDSPLLRRCRWFQYGTVLSSEERKWFTDRERIWNVRYPRAARPFFRYKFRPVHLVQAWLRRTAVQLDYDVLCAKTFVDLLRRLFTEGAGNRWSDPEIIVPVVASGHVKSMHSTENVARILARVHSELGGTVVHWTLREAVRYWKKRIERPGWPAPTIMC